MALTQLEPTRLATQATPFDRLAVMAIAWAAELRRRLKIGKSLAGLCVRALQPACREPLSRNVCDELQIKAWLRSKN